MPDWSLIIPQLEAAGVAVSGDHPPTPVGGGDISAAWRMAADGGDVFIKTGPLSVADMFLAEAEGLAEISRTATVRVPAVIAIGPSEDAAFLALEGQGFDSSGAGVYGQFGDKL